MVMDAAERHGKSVSVCGEMAGHSAATEMLIGMGITELSVTPRLLLELKQRILGVSFRNSRAMIGKLEECTTTQEVYALLNTMSEYRDEGPSAA